MSHWVQDSLNDEVHRASCEIVDHALLHSY